MADDARSITYIGTTDFRNHNIRFGIRAKDRLRHTYIVGATGVGKSTLIENLIIQDIQNGNGVAMFDPHGSSAEKILDYIPPERLQDVVYFAPFDLEYPIAFNPLEDPGPDLRYQVSDGLLSAFKKIWPDAFSARMEYILSMTLLALLEYPGSTLLAVNRMLSEKQFRIDVVNNVTDPSVKAFWVDEFMKWDDKFAREASAAIQNKVGQFTSNPLIRNILGQPVSTINFRDILDSKKIFIANLSKGRVGEQNAPLLGAMLITKLYLAAMSRADRSESQMFELPPFYLYVDEFQNFANDSFENILSESRKYKLGLTIAHQYVHQMPENIQAAVFGNVGTKIIFRTQKPEDAEIFEKAFAPIFVQTDFMNLGMAQIYLTLMIDGVGSAPFSARTMPPIAKPIDPIAARVIASSRSVYAHPRAEVERVIAEWYTPRQSNPGNQLRSANNSQNSENTKQEQKPKEFSEEEKKKRDEYYAEKKKEIESKGGVWMDPAEYRKIKEEKKLAQEKSGAPVAYPYTPRPDPMPTLENPVVIVNTVTNTPQSNTLDAITTVEPNKVNIDNKVGAEIDKDSDQDLVTKKYVNNPGVTDGLLDRVVAQKDIVKVETKPDTTIMSNRLIQKSETPQTSQGQSQAKSIPISPSPIVDTEIGESKWIDLSDVSLNKDVEYIAKKEPEIVKNTLNVNQQKIQKNSESEKTVSGSTASALKDALEKAKSISQRETEDISVDQKTSLTNNYFGTVYQTNETSDQSNATAISVDVPNIGTPPQTSQPTPLSPEKPQIWGEISPSQLAQILGTKW